MDTHPNTQKERRFLISLTLTGLIFFAEFLGGFWAGSLALLSDSAHVFMDAFALGVSYLAIRAAALPPNQRHTYGYHRMQVLAALFNGATLLLISFEIFREAWIRFFNPQQIRAVPMLVIAVIGLVVNIIVAVTLHEHDHKDINTRSAYLHVLGDALASIGVIIAGVIIYYTSWNWLDPLIGVFIGALILFSSGRILKETVHILAEGMPDGMTTRFVLDTMKTIKGVSGIHDLHVWSISPDYIALSAHVILHDQAISHTEKIMEKIRTALKDKFGIKHTTIQFECENCGQGAATCLSDKNHIGV